MNDRDIIKGSKNHRMNTAAPAKKTVTTVTSPAAIIGRRIVAPIILEKKLLARASRYPPMLNPPLYDHK